MIQIQICILHVINRKRINECFLVFVVKFFSRHKSITMCLFKEIGSSDTTVNSTGSILPCLFLQQQILNVWDVKFYFKFSDCWNNKIIVDGLDKLFIWITVNSIKRLLSKNENFNLKFSVSVGS